jgi:hypothetical protein
MSELSPITQAVLTAYNQRELATKRTTALAAALRAAAIYSYCPVDRQRLAAIANELETQP